MDILFVVLYAIFIGVYNVCKKLSVVKSHQAATMVLFTSTAFILSLLWIPFGVLIPWRFVWLFVLKGFLLALSWFMILNILKTVDLTIVTVTDVLSAVLSFLLGIVLFQEIVSWLQIVGAILVVFSVAAINLCNRRKKGSANMLQIFCLIISALISSSSSVIDRYTTNYLTNYQVQFWFLFFVCLFAWLFFIIECLHSRQCLLHKNDFTNYWIYLIGIFLFLGDYFLFRAYKVPGSQMSTISILSKLKMVITVLTGIIIFHEKNIVKKLILTAVVISGAVLISIG